MSTAHPKATKLQHAYMEAYVLSIVYNIHEHGNNTIKIGQKSLVKLKVQDLLRLTAWRPSVKIK